VALVATGTLTLLVSNDVPAKTIQEFVALAKSRPGKLNYASNGNGTIQHLAMELFKLEAGIDMTHVPYKTAGPAFNDLVGGRVDAMIQTINTGAPFVQAGKIRVLAVLDDERSPIYKSTPTFAESGYPKLNIYTWYGMFAPGGTPAEIVTRLNRETNSILGLKEVQALLEKQGLNPLIGPPSKMGDLLRLELERWPRVVQAAGIKGD
jgi:tripartite-type tricarboxylate transporter receptor subunit TctC